EMACDNYVLGVGTRPSDYAGHLLEIAKSLGRRNQLAPAAVGMACSQLENRVRAILDPNAKRRGIDAPMALLLTAGALCLIVPLAMARPSNRAETSIKGDRVESISDADSNLHKIPEVKLQQEASKTSSPGEQSKTGDSQIDPSKEVSENDQDQREG